MQTKSVSKKNYSDNTGNNEIMSSAHLDFVEHCLNRAFLLFAACKEYYCCEDIYIYIYVLQDKKLVKDIF